MSSTVNAVPCKPTTRPPCRREAPNELSTYEDIVAAYIRDHRPGVLRLLRFFRDRPSLEEAIDYAARCKLPSGKRHPHQYRIPKPALPEAERRLRACATELCECKSFADLHEFVRDHINSVRGIGVLTVYDIAHHLGAYLGLEPKAIYLHAGTAGGARALGLDHTAETLDLAAFPPSFCQLRPHEVEDCLCIYLDELEAIGSHTGHCT
jgi:hypothetical protein